MAVEVKVYTTGGVLQATFTDVWGWRWSYPSNTVGDGEFTVRRADANYAQLQKGRLARIVDDGVEVAELLLLREDEIRRTAVQVEADDAVYVTWSGPTSGAVLGSYERGGGVVYPEYWDSWGRRDSARVRYFGPMSPDYDGTNLNAPVSYGTQANPDTGTIPLLEGRPQDWPDGQAEWLAPVAVDVNGDHAAGVWHIRREWTWAQDYQARISVTADGYFELWFDGAPVVATEDRRAWVNTYTAEVFIDSDFFNGAHCLYMRVTNRPKPVPSWQNVTLAIVNISEVNEDGSLAGTLIRTFDSSTWQVSAIDATLGMSAARIMDLLLDEHSTRAAGAGLSTPLDDITRNWTITAQGGGMTDQDADGNNMTNVTVGFNVGTPYLQVLETLVQTHDVDWHMAPGLQLSIWNSRGTDRGATPDTGASTVTLAEGTNIVDSIYASEAQRLSRLLVETEDGFKESTKAGATVLLEQAATFGNQPFGDTLDDFATYTFGEIGADRVDAVFVVDGSGSAKPHVDFDVEDIIQAPDVDGSAADFRVTQIQGRQLADNPAPLYSVSCEKL